ncbi:ABC-type transport system permease protein (probable substrate zinc/manganese/metal ions) [Natronomonas pharaonis DSM 2160]|uniref:ABC-type transport system permease protein (Probable substrate zinc/manganese/metal ions) n=1 Tax=Natronomonas pharaonis (strain ATCC 35678 / DSM 2160 / CIP 103997 / JCM 8858 / NBRC 14720 / NCIMB 2260 / Gabara) TaxID=348780 RepID=A0A1U7EYY5_NATPD|nr:metal ABC transporter permease [Natronomonas pharaonis]CAI50457.1 ABC-type transport system permease protein (probable substrate zinc/manganese/metal ions) [Natronomonas pharaonis DSM 2160]
MAVGNIRNREYSTRALSIPVLLVAFAVFIVWLFPPLFERFWGVMEVIFNDHWLVSSSFLQHGFTAGVLIGFTAPVVGSYLVNRQMALIGEALAHTAFGGVAIGLFVGAAVPDLNYPLVWALVVATIAALGMQYVAVKTDGYADIPIAIMLTGGFAVGIAVISYGVVFSATVESYLFGDILFVPFENVQLMVGLTLLVGLVVGLTHKQLKFITFDREAARLARINVWFYDTLLIVLTALVVVAAMQILGAILVAGMLVIPVAAAMQVTGSFNRGMLMSVGFGQVAVIGGILSSYYLGIATGPMIIIVAILIYIGAVLS